MADLLGAFEMRLEESILSADDERRIDRAYAEGEALFEWTQRWWDRPKDMRIHWDHWTYALKRGSVVAWDWKAVECLTKTIYSPKAR